MPTQNKMVQVDIEKQKNVLQETGLVKRFINPYKPDVVWRGSGGGGGAEGKEKVEEEEEEEVDDLINRKWLLVYHFWWHE